MTGPAPGMYRVSRILQALGTVALVVLILFLATVAYSAAHLRPQVGGRNGGHSAVLDPNGTAVLTDSINISNPGYYAISPLTVALQVRNVSGALLGVGGSPSLTIAGGSNASIPFSIWVPLSTSDRALLTQDTSLPVHVWVNATFASIFIVHLSGTTNYSWGAPFSGLSVVPGAPSLQGNGTVLVPVTVTFSNHASFPDVGVLTMIVRTSTGATCATASTALDVPPQGQFDQVLSFYGQPSCNPSGGTISSAYSGNGLIVALPTETIP